MLKRKTTIRRSVSRKVKRPLKKTFSRGFLSTISNPSGKRKRAVVVQGLGIRGKGKSNYQAYTNYPKNPRLVGHGKSAEGLANRVARKGHKKVKIID